MQTHYSIGYDVKPFIFLSMYTIYVETSTFSCLTYIIIIPLLVTRIYRHTRVYVIEL